jgi:hypothetical protein
MSFQAMTWAVKQELPAMQKIVLLMMANRTNPETGACFPSVKTLSVECGMAIRSVTNQISILKDTGLISVINQFEKDGRQTSNSYRLNFDKEVKFRDLAEDDSEQADYAKKPIFSPAAENADTGVQQIVTGSAADAYKTEKLNTNNKTTSVSNARASVAEFVPPLAQDVFNYWAAMCLLLPIEQAEAFIDHYASVGWMSGKTPIVDWYAKARSWAARKKIDNLTPKNYPKKAKQDFKNPPKYSLDDDFGNDDAIDSFAVPLFQIGG